MTNDFSRLDDADVIFLCQEGYRLAPARVRCYHFADALSRRGLRCEVVSFTDHFNEPSAATPADRINDAEKIRLNAEVFAALSRNRRAVLYVQKVNHHALAALLAAQVNGNRYILDYDDYDLETRPFPQLDGVLSSLGGEALFATVARGAAACIASSHQIFELIRPYNPNTHLIHTVADTTIFFDQGREQPRRRFGEAVNILWCGDVWGTIPMGDILFAVDAFALMPRATQAKARFHIIGFGSAWNELKRRIRLQYPDLSAVVFHERIAPNDIGAVLREMDIGVLPYANNMFNASKSPTKMFEFLLSKVVVCSTPVGEAPHCLTHGESAMFAEGLEGYAAALATLIDDDPLRHRLAHAAHKLACQTYTLDAVAPRLEAVIRQVAAADKGDLTSETAEAFLVRRLGRYRWIAPRELTLIRQDLAALASSGNRESVNPRRWSAPLLALLEWPGIADDLGLSPAAVMQLREDGQRYRNATRLRPEITLPSAPRPEGPPALCKLAASEDWDSRDWFVHAVRFKTNYASFLPGVEEWLSSPGLDAPFDPIHHDDVLNQVSNYFKRSRGSWARTHILYGLERLGKLHRGVKALMPCDQPDSLYLALTEHIDHVRVADLSPDALAHKTRLEAGERDLWLMRQRLFDFHRIRIDHIGPEGAIAAENGPVDVMIALRDVVARLGIPAVLALARRFLAPDGVLALACDISVNSRGIAPTPADVMTAIVDDGGFTVSGDFDASVSDATLDRLVIKGAPGADNPLLVMRDGDALVMSGVWFLRPCAIAEPLGRG